MFRRIRYELIKVLRSHGTSHEIAFGAAIGAFISIFPTFGTGTLLVLLAYRFINFNLVSAISGSLISNVFTGPFFMALSYKIGAVILRSNFEFDFKTWYKQLDQVGLSLLVGSLLLSTVCSVAIYFLIKKIVGNYKNRFTKNLST
ncbi:MAG: DUF2062 domain-containing protein [Saprospiraceae bacterium]|nr:DUF2062 domain-containing protein [Saprospiraceae bacterium]HRG68913.1 DUF2062 domain-containing protein [Saprospiraceae bacterium]